MFVAFCETFSFRDLKADTETLHQNAGLRGSKNPMFQDADLLLEGCVVREVPEILTIGTLTGTSPGASSADVASNFLCGAQAVGAAWGQTTKFVVKNDKDYDNQHAVAVGEIRGVEKLSHDSIQNGIVTMYTAAVADS